MSVRRLCFFDGNTGLAGERTRGGVLIAESLPSGALLQWMFDMAVSHQVLMAPGERVVGDAMNPGRDHALGLARQKDTRCVHRP